MLSFILCLCRLFLCVFSSFVFFFVFFISTSIWSISIQLFENNFIKNLSYKIYEHLSAHAWNLRGLCPWSESLIRYSFKLFSVFIVGMFSPCFNMNLSTCDLYMKFFYGGYLFFSWIICFNFWWVK